ncbi:MAG: phosphate ABC transporter substrate-binding/OmpA family protein, partial [Azospirillaceae bacterium]|nr:phosphate ABC transporter substrate-binding/OmpA family protein [Azospirillaceae bacterium]
PAAPPPVAAPVPAPAAVPAAAPAPAAPPETAPYRTILRLAGSNTIGSELGPKWVAAMLTAHGYQNVQILVQGEEQRTVIANAPGTGERVGVEIAAHGSATAFKALASGEADVGEASRPINDKEVEALKSLGDMRSSSNEHVGGLDGVAVVVHRANPVSRLSVEQIAGLFSGKFTNWSQVGGADVPVKVLARDNKSGTWDTFNSLVLSHYKMELRADAARIEDSNELANRVAADPGAIGFIGLAFTGPTKALAVSDGDGAALYPSAFTVATEDYPLARRLFLYTSQSPQNPLITDYVSFAISPEGQAIVNQVGFVGQNIEAVEQPLAADAPADYVKAVAGATRLSVNFRFKPNSSQFDNKATRDIDRLVQFVAAQKSGSRPQVFLFGFTDNSGNAAANLQLSQARADAVAQELASHGMPATSIRGMGPIMPIAPNSSPDGRERNRRVEIWVKSASRS